MVIFTDPCFRSHLIMIKPKHVFELDCFLKYMSLTFFHFFSVPEFVKLKVLGSYTPGCEQREWVILWHPHVRWINPDVSVLFWKQMIHPSQTLNPITLPPLARKKLKTSTSMIPERPFRFKFSINPYILAGVIPRFPTHEPTGFVEDV